MRMIIMSLCVKRLVSSINLGQNSDNVYFEIVCLADDTAYNRTQWPCFSCKIKLNTRLEFYIIYYYNLCNRLDDFVYFPFTRDYIIIQTKVIFDDVGLLKNGIEILWKHDLLRMTPAALKTCLKFGQSRQLLNSQAYRPCPN